MNESSDYRKAYETAKRELSGLIANQERLEKRKLSLRKTIETLAALCESEGVEIEPSPEADYLRMHSTLSDEIRNVLKAHYPAALQPLQVKKELEALGHDLGKYSNAQATIHMVLKRMDESHEVAETATPEGKKAYLCNSLWESSAIARQGEYRSVSRSDTRAQVTVRARKKE